MDLKRLKLEAGRPSSEDGSSCNELNVYVLPEFLSWNPNLQRVGIWRLDFWEAVRSWEWNPHKRSSGELPSPSTMKGCRKRGHNKKMAIHEPGSGSPADAASANTLTFHFAASRIVRNKFLLFKSPNLWCSAIADWADSYSQVVGTSDWSKILKKLQSWW